MKLRTGDVDTVLMKVEYNIHLAFYGEVQGEPQKKGVYFFCFREKEEPENKKKYAKSKLNELVYESEIAWAKVKFLCISCTPVNTLVKKISAESSDVGT